MTIPQPPEPTGSQPDNSQPDAPQAPPAYVPPAEPHTSQYAQQQYPQPTQQYAQQQPYGQPQYGQPGYAQPGYAQPTEGLAIAGLITGILFWPAGIIISPIALSKIKKTGNGGRGLAIAGLILSILGALGTIAGIIVFAISIAISAATIGTIANQTENLGEITSSVGVGEAAVTESGLSYTVNEMQCGIGEVGEDYSTTEPTGEYCRVSLTFLNGSDSSEYLTGTATGYIGSSQYSDDSLAATYAAMAEGKVDDSSYAEVTPGNEVTTDLYFDVPAGSELDRIEFQSFSSILDGSVEVVF